MTTNTEQDRLPTREEAHAAIDLLARCNGHDLDTWTDGIWPSDELAEVAKATRATRLRSHSENPL